MVKYLIPLLLTGCLKQQAPDFYTANGGRMYDMTKNRSMGFSKVSVDAMESRLVETLDEDPKYPASLTEPILGKAWIYVVDDIPGNLAGQEDGICLYIKNQRDVNHSALAHEEFHLIQEAMYGILDYDHKDPWWKVIDSLQVEIEKE
jgi:hypothetical protein